MFKRAAARIARPDLFSMEAWGEATVLRLRHQEVAGADPERVRQLWSFLSYERTHPSKVLVIQIPPGLLGPENAGRFLAEQHPGAGGVSARSDLFEEAHREENLLANLIDRIGALDSLVILALQGEVDLPFLGPALACDYRVVSDDTVFVNSAVSRGLPPFGALPWFMVRALGYARAASILWGEESLGADRAHRLGLVNEVSPLAELDERVRKAADRFVRKPRARLVAIKRLLDAACGSWDAYSGVEHREVNRCLDAIVRGRPAGP